MDDKWDTQLLGAVWSVYIRSLLCDERKCVLAPMLGPCQANLGLVWLGPCQTCIWHDIEKHGNLEQTCPFPLKPVRLATASDPCAWVDVYVHSFPTLDMVRCPANCFFESTWCHCFRRWWYEFFHRSRESGRRTHNRSSFFSKWSLKPRFTCWTLSASPFWTEHWRQWPLRILRMRNFLCW